MSDEVTNVQITVEQILAAILHKVGIVEITEDELLADYSNFAVAVEPAGEKVVQFSLVDAGMATDESE